MGSKKSQQELIQQSRSQDFEAVDKRQEKVAQEHLEPAIGPLLEWVHRLRAAVDRSFRQAIHECTRQAEPTYGTIGLHGYPKGFCGHIRDAILQAMLKAVAAGEEGEAQRSLRAFIAQGGICKAIHGIDVTGPYFQNAIQLGPYYLDVANDTVDLQKPPILCERMTPTRFENIKGLDRYFQVAKLYLRLTIFPNHFFPWLSPICPALIVNAAGFLELPTLPMGLVASILLSDLRLSQHFLANSFVFTNTTLPEPYGELLLANSPALADDPLFAVNDQGIGQLDDTFAKLRALSKNGPDRYLIYFQHYQAVRTAQQRFHALKLRPTATQLLALQKKGLLPAFGAA